MTLYAVIEGITRIEPLRDPAKSSRTVLNDTAFELTFANFFGSLSFCLNLYPPTTEFSKRIPRFHKFMSNNSAFN